MREVTRYGAKYRLNLSDFVQWRTYWGIQDIGKDRLLSQLHPGHVFLDVGANIGEICFAAAKRVGEGGRVMAFEPIRINFDRLQETLSLNPELQARTQLFPFALGEKDQKEVAFIHPRKDNQGMMRVKGEGMEDEVYAKVKMRSLDSLLEEKGVKHIDFIKIDVEGYELNVLKGAKKSLLKYRPHLFIELDDSNLKAQGDSAKALLGWLEELGYDLEDAVSGRSLSASQSFEGCHFDIIARFRS